MKKLFLTLIMILFCGFLQAQVPLNEITLQTLTPFDEDITNSLKISSAQNSIMVGRIEGPVEDSNIFVLISPKIGAVITIEDLSNYFPGIPGSGSTYGGATATIIRPKKPGTDGGGRFINSESLSSEIVLFPNPIQNEINVNSPTYKIIQYCVFDQLGRNLIDSKPVPSENIIINSVNLQAGTYFLKLELENKENKIIQFIKN